MGSSDLTLAEKGLDPFPLRLLEMKPEIYNEMQYALENLKLRGEERSHLQYEGLKYWEQTVRSHDLEMTLKGILRQLGELLSERQSRKITEYCQTNEECPCPSGYSRILGIVYRLSFIVRISMDSKSHMDQSDWFLFNLNLHFH